MASGATAARISCANIDKHRILPPAMFEGTYKRPFDEHGFVIEELTFQRPSADGLMQVTKVEERYPPRHNTSMTVGLLPSVATDALSVTCTAVGRSSRPRTR